jgi:murein DD-endopeptidase MepM/ murein hydrolase activator NlpD
VLRRIVKITAALLVRIRQRMRRNYYYLDEGSRLHEVRRFPVKFAAAVAISTSCCLGLLLCANHLSGDPLGIGADRAISLRLENQVLHERLAGFSGRVKELESELNLLNEQGNRLRLLVDLPGLDNSTASAGTGGAVPERMIDVGSDDAARILHSASVTLEQLGGQLRVQEQSYGQITRKYEYNKGLFRALPALKPMEGFYSVGEFGLRMHPVLGIFKTHEGLDIVNDVGTPVVAAADGTVEMAGESGGGYGITVVLRHGYGYQTLYGHLSRVLVRAGQHVVRGQVIAKSGRSGLVSGPHLHYEVRLNGVCKNPADYFFDDVKPLDYRAQLAAH